MGLAKYAQLQAATELARRALREELSNGSLFDSPTAVSEWLRLNLAHLEHEVFMVLLLNARHQLIDAVELFRGTLTQTSVYPREVVKLTLKANAAAVILAHNHPPAQPNRAPPTATSRSASSRHWRRSTSKSSTISLSRATSTRYPSLAWASSERISNRLAGRPSSLAATVESGLRVLRKPHPIAGPSSKSPKCNQRT